MTQDHVEALRLYQLAAQQGYNEAEAWVAFSYLEGEGGVFRNEKEAFRLASVGVTKNIPIAYYILAACYLDGRGVKRDVKRGVELLEGGVVLQESYAKSQLGVCYYQGWGVGKDEKEAVRYYRLSAQQGNAVGQYQLGIY